MQKSPQISHSRPYVPKAKFLSQNFLRAKLKTPSKSAWNWSHKGEALLIFQNTSKRNKSLPEIWGKAVGEQKQKEPRSLCEGGEGDHKSLADRQTFYLSLWNDSQRPTPILRFSPNGNSRSRLGPEAATNLKFSTTPYSLRGKYAQSCDTHLPKEDEPTNVKTDDRCRFYHLLFSGERREEIHAFNK